MRYALVELETICRRLTQPPCCLQVIGILSVLRRSQADLLAENVFLHQQLILVSHQAKPPCLTRRDDLHQLQVECEYAMALSPYFVYNQ